jgi:hypothetical protein
MYTIGSRLLMNRVGRRTIVGMLVILALVWNVVGFGR